MSSANVPRRRLPPLVEPGAELSQREMERYSRHILIPGVGVLGQRRLRAARALVIGAGGLGSPALQYLAAAGVGTIGVVDFDDVEVSNLHRQVIHSESDVGRPKVDSAADAVAAVNPLVTVVRHDVRLTSHNALDVIDGYDVVLDGTDNFATRYLVNDACVLAGKPYVWGSIYRFEGQVSVFWAKHGPNYRDIYPQPPAPGSVPSCAQGGVLGVLCATIGSLMGTEAIKLICGIGDSLLGRVLMYDALTMSFRTVTVGVDQQAKPVTELIDYDEFCGTAAAAEPVEGTVSPRYVRERLSGRSQGVDDFLLIDVREPGERELVSIDGSISIPQELILSGSVIPELPRDREIVLYCRSGARSAACLVTLQRAGFSRVRHLEGGILAWADQIEPALPRY